jgi:hypothetical protein
MVIINLDLFASYQSTKNPTIADVKEWMNKVSLLNLPDDHPLYALELGLSYSIDSSNFNPIICGDCSPQDDTQDIIISTHSHS